MAARADRVVLGVVIGAHGRRGALRIKSFTAAPRDIAAYGALYCGARDKVVTIARVTADKKGVLAHIDGVTTRTAAEALVGQELSVARARLPAGEDEEFYQIDLIGLRAVSPQGVELGRVTACHNFGAGDVLEIGGAFYPFTRASVPEIDVAGGRLVLAAPIDSET